MKRSIRLFVGVGSLVATLSLSGTAGAITVPDSGTCNTGSTCFQINQNGSGTSQIAIGGTATTANGSGVVGVNSSASANGAGVVGSAPTGTGVYGFSTSGTGVIGRTSSQRGVYGESQTGNGVWGYTIQNSTNAAVVGQSFSNSNLAFYGLGGITITGVGVQPGGGMWTAPSDQRIKKDVADFSLGLEKLMQVHPVRFRYNGLGGTTDDGKQYVGVIAQDLEKVLPTMVTSHATKLHPTDSATVALKEVDPSDFTYLLINAVKEQQRVIERQEARIEALERRQPPLASSLTTLGTIETAGVFGLIPVGLFAAARKRKKQDNN